MCLKCPPPARTHDLGWSRHYSIAASVMPGQSRSLHQAFLKVVDVMNLCFIHALLYNTPDK